MQPPSKDSKFVWVDLEFTDLDLENGKIVEIACVITDGQLNKIINGPDIVINQPESVLDSMNDWCKKHFGESGLTNEIRESKISIQEAETQVLEFIKKHCSSQNAVLAGSSVGIDKTFLAKYMPSITDYLHYRIVDVSTIKELARHWYPNLPSFPKADAHRALSDILESIEELKYYRSEIFKKS